MGSKSWLSVGSVVVAVVLFFAVNIFSENELTQWRFDLTQNHLYTLTQGTRNILTGLKEPITLKFFLSREVATNVPAVASYSRRVEDLLREYQRRARGKINLEIIDPEPFSVQEDQAEKYGLHAVSVNGNGDSLYFGLVGTNSVDDQQVISFFSPSRQKQLEYDVTRLIYQLSQTKTPVVGLISSVPLKMPPSVNPAQSRSWLIVDQMEKLFTVENIKTNSGAIPKDVDVLMIVHPGQLGDKMLYAIDQFVLSGGHALVFVDPYMEADARGEAMARGGSGMEPLFKKWGFQLVHGKIAADMSFAERVRYTHAGRQVIGAFPVWLNIRPSYFDSGDVVTANLGNIVLATPGVLEKLKDAKTTFTPLIHTTNQAAMLNTSLIEGAESPDSIIQAYKPGSKTLTLAARVSGPAQTAFPDGPPESKKDKGASGNGDQSRSEEQGAGQGGGSDQEAQSSTASKQVKSSKNINVIVVADADMLHEQFWARRQNLFGNQIIVPSAANADFVINALENLTGSNDLISVRSRGEFTRPFTRIDRIREQAELKYRQKEQELKNELDKTQKSLMALEQGKRNQRNRLMLSEAQQKEIEKFRDEKVRIRKELRQVQHQLRKDIDALEAWLKFINIGLLPLLIIVGATLVSIQRARRRRR
ncbi:MAG: Gldg family protein [Arenicellales bacterium]